MFLITRGVFGATMVICIFLDFLLPPLGLKPLDQVLAIRATAFLIACTFIVVFLVALYATLEPVTLIEETMQCFFMMLMCVGMVFLSYVVLSLSGHWALFGSLLIALLSGVAVGMRVNGHPRRSRRREAYVKGR